MGGLGFGELVIILIIVMLVFGVGKLPQLGDALGRSIRNFKKAATQSDEIDVTPRPAGLPQGTDAAKAPAPAADEARKA